MVSTTWTDRNSIICYNNYTGLNAQQTTLLFQNTTICNNNFLANTGGGGVSLISSTMTGAILQNNYANVGAGVYSFNSGVRNCTITNNRALNGAGVYALYKWVAQTDDVIS